MYEGLPKISGDTFFYKRVFPAMWFGFLAFMVVLLLVVKPIAVFHPLAMATFGYFLFRRLVWDLADEVLDGGTFLLVRKGDLAERVELRDVMNVNLSQTNPPRVTLKLRTPGMLGDEIVFSPIRQRSFKLFARNALVDELIVRVDAARMSR